MKARKYLMKETLISLHYFFVYPYLIYLNYVCGVTCETYRNVFFFFLQKIITRIIAGVNRRAHTGPIFKELELLKYYDIKKYRIGRLMVQFTMEALFCSSHILRKLRKFIDMVLDK